jgi:hypothetical protein
VRNRAGIWAMVLAAALVLVTVLVRDDIPPDRRWAEIDLVGWNVSEVWSDYSTTVLVRFARDLDDNNCMMLFCPGNHLVNLSKAVDQESLPRDPYNVQTKSCSAVYANRHIIRLLQPVLVRPASRRPRIHSSHATALDKPRIFDV